MEFINLAMSEFKLDCEDDHRRFVRSLTEGVDWKPGNIGDSVSQMKSSYICVKVGGRSFLDKNTREIMESTTGMAQRPLMWGRLSSLAHSFADSSDLLSSWK